MAVHRILTVTALLGVIGAGIWSVTRTEPAAGGRLRTVSPVPVVGKDAKQRPVYRHSVVSGGVYSSDEAIEVTGRDRVVDAHYRGMNARRLTAVVMEQDAERYVSYRRGDKVFWTAKRVRIPRGEMVLTDGAYFLRARCGNRLSEAPQSPVAEADEPTESELEQTDAAEPGTPALKARSGASAPERQYREVAAALPRHDVSGPAPFGMPGWLPSMGGVGVSPRGGSDPLLPPAPPAEWPKPSVVQPPVVDPTIPVVYVLPPQIPGPARPLPGPAVTPEPELPRTRPDPDPGGRRPAAPDPGIRLVAEKPGPTTPTPGTPGGTPDLEPDNTVPLRGIPTVPFPRFDDSTIPRMPLAGAEVPEPGTLLLVGLTLLGAASLKRYGF